MLRLLPKLPFTAVRSFCSASPSTRVTVLPSGLRVATEKHFGQTATVAVFIDAGSALETPENNGTAHFLEHMAFKGTKKRSKQQIEVEVENAGALLNAYTSREQTVYNTRVFEKDVPMAVDLLSDILQNSELSEEHVNAERSVILREMEEVNKNYDEVVFDHLHATAYQNHPLGYTILGPEKNIKSITRDQMADFINKNYTADSMVLVGAGAVDHDQLVSLAESAFADLPTQSPNPSAGAVDFVGGITLHRDDEMNVLHGAIAFESVGWSHPDYYNMLVLQAMVGNWSRASGVGTSHSSYLCELVAQENLCNSLQSFTTCYHNTGLFGTVFQASHGDESKMSDLVYSICNQYNKLAHNPSPAAVERAKNSLKASILLHLDGSLPVCEDIGRQLLTLGERRDTAQVCSMIDSVSAQSVKAAARKYLTDVDPSVVALGPTNCFPDYTYIRDWVKWKIL